MADPKGEGTEWDNLFDVLKNLNDSCRWLIITKSVYSASCEDGIDVCVISVLI